MDDFTDRLRQLETDILRDFEYLDYPAENWVTTARMETCARQNI